MRVPNEEGHGNPHGVCHDARVRRRCSVARRKRLLMDQLAALESAGHPAEEVVRMRRKRVALLLCAGAVTAVAAVAAGIGQRPSEQGVQSLHHPVCHLGGVHANALGAKAAAKELGDTVTYSGPTAVSPTAQVPFIDSAVRHGANAIIISSDDRERIAPALKRAAAKGVKVVSYELNAPDDAHDLRQPAWRRTSLLPGRIARLADRLQGADRQFSTTRTAANQNNWIKYMEQALTLPKYKGMRRSRSLTATTTTRGRRRRRRRCCTLTRS